MEATDTQAYFLAGHSAPAGVYRETQTGRELRLEVEGMLPATGNGHVAVYVPLPPTWAELRCQKRV